MRTTHMKLEWLTATALACVLGLAFDTTRIYAQDLDGDTIPDSVDLDDDNDGILDTDEMASPNVLNQSSWVNQVGGITAVENTLHFSASASSSWTSSINSLDFTQMGVGGTYTFSFTLDQGDISNVLLGLNKAGPNYGTSTTWSDVDHAIYVRSDGSLRIYENGSNKIRTTYAAGDVISIEVAGSTLEYKQNGTSLRTMTISSGQNFTIDASFPGGAPSDYSISNIQVCSGDLVSNDSDGDGLADHRDMDSDGDGISDLVESGQDPTLVDTDNDGRHDGAVNASGIPEDAAGGMGVSLVDTDNDGFYDVVDLDSDNDSQPDFNEHIAGTDPVDASSTLRIDIQSSAYGGESLIVFTSVPGRRYKIEGRTNLKDGAWVALHSGLVGNGGVISLPVTSETSCMCYRLGVALL